MTRAATTATGSVTSRGTAPSDPTAPTVAAAALVAARRALAAVSGTTNAGSKPRHRRRVASRLVERGAAIFTPRVLVRMAEVVTATLRAGRGSTPPHAAATRRGAQAVTRVAGPAALISRSAAAPAAAQQLEPEVRCPSRATRSHPHCICLRRDHPQCLDLRQVPRSPATSAGVVRRVRQGARAHVAPRRRTARSRNS